MFKVFRNFAFLGIEKAHAFVFEKFFSENDIFIAEKIFTFKMRIDSNLHLIIRRNFV